MSIIYSYTLTCKICDDFQPFISSAVQLELNLFVFLFVALMQLRGGIDIEEELQAMKVGVTMRASIVM